MASRDLERSRRFIAECQAQTPFATPPLPLGSYEALLAAKNVDAVYIPLPTGLRKEWVVRAAAAGKHVICEEPCGVGFADVREMTDACKKNRVQFMDGVMFMQDPRCRVRRPPRRASRPTGARVPRFPRGPAPTISTPTEACA